MDWVSFAIPVLPVLLCCLLSTSKIWFSTRFTSSLNHLNQVKVRATVTILIFTGTYVVFNIPIFVLFVLRLLLFPLKEKYPGRFFSNWFIYRYGWNLCKMLLPAINSALNPIIYYTRMNRFKAWLLGDQFKQLVGTSIAPHYRSDAGLDPKDRKISGNRPDCKVNSNPCADC